MAAVGIKVASQLALRERFASVSPGSCLHCDFGQSADL
jgi:hypothetical protein